MKYKNTLLSIIVLVSASVFGQQSTSVSEIPDNVKAKMHQLYPNVTDVTWEQEESYFVPVFMVNNVKTKLLIDPKGALIQTSAKLQPSVLPATVTAYVSANYPGQNISDAEQLTMINNSTRYEAVVGTKDLVFDANGQFIKITHSPLKQ
jgi:hypothetical protein